MTFLRWCQVEICIVVLVLSCGAVYSWSIEPAATVRLGTRHFSGVVGETIEVQILGIEQPLPSGYMYSVTADTIDTPGEVPPEILTGLPMTRVRCVLPGLYKLRIKVNLIHKTSCGGASARTLMIDEVLLNIAVQQ